MKPLSLTNSIQRTATLLTALLLPLVSGSAALPTGFSEPPVTIYGRVLNVAGSHSTQVYAGTTLWTITPAPGNGDPVTVSASLENLGNGAFSYRIEIPVSKAPSGSFRIIPETIPATSTAKTCTLSATVNGQSAVMVLPAGTPHPATTETQEIFRGKTERIDLQFSGTTDDTDGDGIPDWWESYYAPATDPNNPNDPLSDPDADGDPNLAEYQNGTDPSCLEYVKWLTRYDLSNAPDLSKPEDDPDKDGIRNIMEYALGGDPRTPDAESVRSRIQPSIESSGNQRFLKLTVTRPAARQCNAEYIVEASGDLTSWQAQEGTDVLTLLNSGSVLQVRDAGVISSLTGRKFLRLKIQPRS